jgi:GNAT superfamily N-acetyltransferase
MRKVAIQKAAPVAAALVEAVTASARARLLPDGYVDVPAGRLAAVVTYLEMTSPPELPAELAAANPRYRMRRVERPEPEWYRALFRAVGERWLWFSRLRMSEAELTGILHDPRVGVYALSSLRLDGRWEDKGLLELDGRVPGEVEIVFFGVTQELIGRGAGPLMMRFALEQAWVEGVRRVHLHTCTLDHPRALAFYLRHGFRAWKRAVEIAPDPRLTGDASAEACAEIPLIAP